MWIPPKVISAYLALQDTKSGAGRYFNRILYLAIKAMFFDSPKDGGIAFPAFFKPVSAETIAIVFTAVSHGTNSLPTPD